MRKWLAVAALGLSWAGFAESPYKAMVLKVSGAPVGHPSEKQNERVVSGQKWAEPLVVDLPAGSIITVLVLSKGERLEITGPGKVKVDRSGLHLEGCSSRSLTSTQHKFAITGENHRQIGGFTVRGGAPASTSAQLDRIEVVGGGAPALVVSKPAGEGSPPGLSFQFLDSYSGPDLNSEFTLVQTQGDRYTIKSEVVKGQKVDSRWEWKVRLPANQDSPLLGFSIAPLQGEGEWLYTKVYLATPQEELELETARKDCLQWAEGEPQSYEPWLIYATLLEEKGRLEEARRILDKALQLEPAEPGLIQMKARLLMDLGRYGQAADLLKAHPLKKLPPVH